MKARMRLFAMLGAVLALAGLSPGAAAQSTYTLPFVLAADTAGLTSFMRIVNRAAQAGTVQIHAIDDTGRRSGPVSLVIGAGAVVHFTSRDLEQGNPEKGLASGVGDGSGNWRLEFTTALDIQPLAYIRTADGFVTAMHDVAPVSGMSHSIAFFNPGSNTRQVSRLRILNPGTTAAQVTISGRDDAGAAAPGGTVRMTLPGGDSRMLTAQALEAGGDGFEGSLGDGAGKWRLAVEADQIIEVMSLLRSPTGHLANLSTAPVTTVAEPPDSTFRAPDMVTVPAGSYMMGSPDSEENRSDNEGPVHRVTIAYSFAVGKYEVTRGEFARFVSETGYAADNRCWLEPRTGWSIEHSWRNPGFTQTDDHPVVCVNWFDAKAYVAWLSEKTGDEYRLLTESEWEYVARGGTETPWFWGDSSERQCQYANARDVTARIVNDQSGGVGCTDGYAWSAPVGSFQPNPFGVHDMAGNAWEWIEDCGGSWRCLSSYEPGTDPNGSATPPVDGSAAYENGTWLRGRRGGSWGQRSGDIRSADRGNTNGIDPTYPSNQGGFRIARTLP